MYKNLLFLILIFVSIVAALALFRSSDNRYAVTQNQQNSISLNQQSKAQKEIVSQEKDGITIEVQAIQQSDTETVLTLSLNNHKFNLSEDSIYDNATLNGKRSLSHTIPSDQVGGHHVTVEVVFPKTTTGELIIAPNDNNIFVFTNLWE